MLASRLLRQQTPRWPARSTRRSQAATFRPSTRAFHASAPRQDPLLDAILYLPHEMMSLIHTVLPWSATIPLAAAINRTLLVTTVGARARSITSRYIGLHPLRQVLAYQKRDEILQSRKGFRTPKEAMTLVKKEVSGVVSEFDKRWNVSIAGQAGWTFAQIPIFLAMAETIRQKCDTRGGLLSLAISPFRSDDAAQSAGEIAATQSQWFAPSLANEGMLWFPDLLLPDPTGALPFILSALMFGNIYFTNNTVHSPARWPTFLRRFLLGVALSIGPLTQDLPAALLLYWGSSTTSVILSNKWLDWKYPAPRALTACKRPLLMPPTPAAKKSMARRL